MTAFRPISEATMNYDDPRLKMSLRPRATFSTSGSSYCNVHLLWCIICIIHLVDCRDLQQGHVGSKTLLQQNPPVLTSGMSAKTD